MVYSPIHTTSHPAAKRTPAGATLSNTMQILNIGRGRAPINHKLEEVQNKRSEKARVARRG